MLTTSIANAAAQSLPADRSRDYDLIRRAIAFLSETWAEQPSLDRLAAHLGLSPAHCQKLFKRWCGLSPKEFVQAITVDHARALLDGSASVLDAAHEVGLSGGSRLHDLFVSHEAMTPGDYKRRGEGLDDGLRLPRLALRRGAADRHRARRRRPRLRRRGQGADAPGRARRHDAALAQGALRRGARQDGAARQADFRCRRLEPRAADAARHDRHRLRRARVGDAAQDPDGPRGQLHRHRPPYRRSPRPRARSARRSGATRSRSWCPATACCGATAASAATTGASRASAP